MAATRAAACICTPACMRVNTYQHVSTHGEGELAHGEGRRRARNRGRNGGWLHRVCGHVAAAARRQGSGVRERRGEVQQRAGGHGRYALLWWRLERCSGVRGSGFGVRGSGFGVRGSGFGVRGSGLRGRTVRYPVVVETRAVVVDEKLVVRVLDFPIGDPSPNVRENGATYLHTACRKIA